MITTINDKNMELHNWLRNSDIPNDGFIITPLNGSREIK